MSEMDYEDKAVAEQARGVWLDFLREPGRKKTKGILERLSAQDERCCLGHACHVLKAKRQVTPHAVFYGEDLVDDVLPEEIANLLNITYDGAFSKPVRIGGLHFMSIADVNDNTEFTPAGIADVLEEQFDAGNMQAFGNL